MLVIEKEGYHCVWAVGVGEGGLNRPTWFQIYFLQGFQALFLALLLRKRPVPKTQQSSQNSTVYTVMISQQYTPDDPRDTSDLLEEVKLSLIKLQCSS